MPLYDFVDFDFGNDESVQSFNAIIDRRAVYRLLFVRPGVRF